MPHWYRVVARLRERTHLLLLPREHRLGTRQNKERPHADARRHRPYRRVALVLSGGVGELARPKRKHKTPKDRAHAHRDCNGQIAKREILRTRRPIVSACS
eukprot:673814-Pleurochrysis_carterae.AAC.1